MNQLWFAHTLFLWCIPMIWAAYVWAMFRVRKKPINNGLKFLQFPLKLGALLWYPAAQRVLQSKLSKQTKQRRQTWLGPLVLAMAVTCFLLALAMPYQLGQKATVKLHKRDLIFVVDASVSMMLKDYLGDAGPIKRIAFMRSVLNRLINAFKGDNMALIVYADQAYQMVPLTDDYKLVRAQVARIDTGIAGRTNEMGKALLLALKLFGQQKQRGSTLYKPTIILLSHGARVVGQPHPIQLVPLFKQFHLKLYTIGIGSRQKLKTDSDPNALIFDPVNTVFLDYLATTTGAHFFWASDVHKVDAMIASIKQREKIQRDLVSIKLRIALYGWPLAVGVLLFFIWQLACLLQATLGRGVLA